VPFGGGKFGEHWGATLRGIMLMEEIYDAPSGNKSSEITFGGRLEIYGQSKVYLNLFRLYGGGGVQRFADADRSPNHGWGGGGQFGFEFFLWRAGSFFIEIGGHSGVARQQDSHALVLAGMNLYPFSI
jgi:hypothetical protein